VGGATSGGPSDASCKNSALDENYYGSSIWATLQLMQSYGLQGDVSVMMKVLVPSHYYYYYNTILLLLILLSYCRSWCPAD
jgi:hypothetical protein